MTTPKPLLPTIAQGCGMLVGGLLGAVGGSITGNESIVVLCYVTGILGGAVIGAMLGWRIVSRQDSDAAHQQ